MVALHSSSFSAAGGKSRSSCARVKASAGVGAATAAWIAALQLYGEYPPPQLSGGYGFPVASSSSLPALSPAPTARSSQAARNEQRHHAEDPGHPSGKSHVHCPWDEGVQHARRSAGKNGTQPLGRDRAPSNVVRSRSAPRSTQLSPPPTPVEALVRAQLLLDFPPAAEKLDEWRATIRSLVAVANKDDPRPAGPSGRRSTEPPHASAGRAGGAAVTVHSPPPRQPTRASARHDDACDNISIASSDPRTHRDQCQILRE